MRAWTPLWGAWAGGVGVSARGALFTQGFRPHGPVRCLLRLCLSSPGRLRERSFVKSIRFFMARPMDLFPGREYCAEVLDRGVCLSTLLFCGTCALLLLLGFAVCFLRSAPCLCRLCLRLLCLVRFPQVLSQGRRPLRRAFPPTAGRGRPGLSLSLSFWVAGGRRGWAKRKTYFVLKNL